MAISMLLCKNFPLDMKKNWVLIVFCLCALLGMHNGMLAQSSDALLARLMQDDKASIEALVLYPEGTRNDILQASLYPEMVVRISEMQRLTSQQFADLLAPFSQDDQQRFWEVARYPGLVENIATRGGLKQADLQGFPDDVHDDAVWADQYHRPTVMKMNDLYGASQTAFEALLRTYPPRAQTAFRNLVALPEVMNILSESLKMTVLVGDMYRKDPAWVSHKLDSLNLEVARKNAEDLQAWRDSLSANPQALQEFQQASEEFRAEQGQPVVTTQQVVQHTTVVNYQYNPYPWWYGYPTWYGYPYWYPQPYYYDWGYYYGPGGVIVVNYLPSPYFTWWYFQRPWHHHHYPHLTHHFLCYHEGHHNSPGGFHREVENWTDEHRNEFGKDWLKNDAGRPDRIKEFGQFEVSYHNAVATQPTKTPNQQTYFETHSKDYPKLNAAVQASPPSVSKPVVARPSEVWPTTKPTPKTYAEPRTNPQPNGQTKPTVQPVQPSTKPRPSNETKPQVQPSNPQPPKIERPSEPAPRNATPAPSYHRDAWQRVEPQPTPTPRPAVQPRPTMQPRQNVAPSQPPIQKGGKR
jgi:hypothetical protein